MEFPKRLAKLLSHAGHEVLGLSPTFLQARLEAKLKDEGFLPRPQSLEAQFVYVFRALSQNLETATDILTSNIRNSEFAQPQENGTNNIVAVIKHGGRRVVISYFEAQDNPDDATRIIWVDLKTIAREIQDHTVFAYFSNKRHTEHETVIPHMTSPVERLGGINSGCADRKAGLIAKIG